MDNIILKVPTYCIKDWRSSSFDEVVTYGEKEKYRLELNRKIPGLKYLRINHELYLDANARMFGKDYAKGFSLETVRELRSILSELGVDLYKNYPSESKLTLAHEKTDMLLDADQVLDELNYLYPPKYAKTSYPHSFSFKNLNKSYKFMVNIYDKHHEMTKIAPKKYLEAGVITEAFQGMTRFETKCNNARTVNWHYGTKNFYEILASKNNQNRVFKELLNKMPMQTKKLDLSLFRSTSELNRFGGAKLLYEAHNGDINAIKRYLESLYGKRTKGNYAFNKFQEMLPLVSNPEGKDLNTLTKISVVLKETSSLEI